MAKRYYAYLLIDENRKGIANRWDLARKIVIGRNARYKGFDTLLEAKEWLDLGASYDNLPKAPMHRSILPGIYFDAGTGRGDGVEVKVTDEKGRSLLDKSNAHGTILLGKTVTNNYGELKALDLALDVAIAKGILDVFGDSQLIIDYWSRSRISRALPKKTRDLSMQVSEKRRMFERTGGKIRRVPGSKNPADLGFHRD